MHIQSKSSSLSIRKSNHVSRCIPIFLAKARTSSVIPTPPKPRSSKFDSDSISDPNESAFIFVEIVGGSLPLSDVLDMKKREKSERFGFSVMEESMGGASLPSGPHQIRMADNLFGFCQSSASRSIGASSSSTVATPISLSIGPVGFHHAKKPEASGFCYVNDIVLGFAKIQ